MASREPHTPIAAERVLMVRGRLAMIWRCPWCTTRQETITEPPIEGGPPSVDAPCRKCERRFRVQPPEGV